ncbi:hypothetical protein Ssi03_46400 [Sphaerisporangium siamense]|uniref:Uncharacterized protein n=1 Tax=Sphaerisporangium siamense TaxID=795645 RepID=A0A7W7D2U7_9ACTN|nr:hypothetical protein [Sphaerisporangium siamense]MBB4699223.1 hypothetical protein [Sphaerisporangium siamense]GII86650.1 hypothetical protein Ssi03_46400 [Sphaerisporangium siamense]
MNEALRPRPARYMGLCEVREFGWRVKLYSYSVAAHREASDGDLAEYIARICISDLERSGRSDEFDYLKFGFLQCHFGRRGLAVGLCHYGLWVDMPEIFAAGWYAYGHEIARLERLDMREPLWSIHELPVAQGEISLFKGLVDGSRDAPGIPWPSISEAYLKSGPAGIA